MDATRASENLEDTEIEQPRFPFQCNEAQLLTFDSFGLFKHSITWSGISPLQSCPISEPICFLTYLKPIDCICASTGKTIHIWQRDRVFTQPIRFDFAHTVHSVLVTEWPHYLIVCTSTTITLYRIQQNSDGSFSFELLKDRPITAPTEVTSTAVSTRGAVFLGGSSGRVYNLTLRESVSPVMSPTVQLRPLGATWRSFFTDPVSSVRSLVLDEDRKRLYSLHSDSRLEAYQSNKDWNKFTKFAYFFEQGIELTSIVVVPEQQRSENCIIGLASDGELHCFRSTCVSTSKSTLWTQFWNRMFGASIQETKLVLQNSTRSICDVVNDHEEEKYRVEALEYHYGTLLLKLRDLGSDKSALVKVRGMTINSVEPVLMLENRLCTFSGHFMVFCRLPSSRWKHSSWRCLDSIELPSEELSLQFFAESPQYIVCAEKDQMIITKDWPCEILAQILKEKNVDALVVFCGLYGAAETVSMALFLALRDEEIAMEFATRNDEIKRALSHGFHIFLKRFLSPIWTKPIFEFHSTEISKCMKLTLPLIEWYLGFMVKLRTVVNRFILGVYSTSAKTSNSIVQSDFYQIVDLNALIYRLMQIFAILKFLHTAKSLEDIGDLSATQIQLLSQQSLRELSISSEKESQLTEFLRRLKFEMQWTPTSDELIDIHGQAPSFFDAIPLDLNDIL